MKSPDPERLVELCKAGSESEAEIIVALLKDEGIPAMGSTRVGDVFGGALDLVIPHRVQVRAIDVELARAYLEESRDLADEIDWDTVDWSAPDAVDRVDQDGELAGPMIDKGLFLRVAAFLAILLLLGFLLTSVLKPGSGSGLFPRN